MFAVLRAIARYTVTGLTLMGQAYAPTWLGEVDTDAAPAGPYQEPTPALFNGELSLLATQYESVGAA
jgi:hypothetical protein